MIPVTHGPPSYELVPWCRLYPNRKRDGWVGGAGAWFLYLYRNRFPSRPCDYVLLLGRPGERPQEAVKMHLKAAGAGEPFLEGRWELATVVVKKGHRDKKLVSYVYLATLPRPGRHTEGEFDGPD